MIASMLTGLEQFFQCQTILISKYHKIRAFAVDLHIIYSAGYTFCFCMLQWFFCVFFFPLHLFKGIKLYLRVVCAKLLSTEVL